MRGAWCGGVRARANHRCRQKGERREAGGSGGAGRAPGSSNQSGAPSRREALPGPERQSAGPAGECARAGARGRAGVGLPQGPGSGSCVFSCEREGALGIRSLEVETFSGPKGESSVAAAASPRPSFVPASGPARPRRLFLPSPSSAVPACVARPPGTGAAARSSRAAGRAGRAALTGERGLPWPSAERLGWPPGLRSDPRPAPACHWAAIFPEGRGPAAGRAGPGVGEGEPPTRVGSGPGSRGETG